MEVKLDKRYPVSASIDQAWAVLSDIRAVGACMPGAQITEQVDDTHYKGTVKTRIGPASMQFNGDIEVLRLDPAQRTLQMLGKGADRGGSSASMKLEARIVEGETPGTCVLVGQATVTVSGKLAQFGSRLLVPVSDAMLAQFADQFRAVAAAVAAPTPEPASADAAATARARDAAQATGSGHDEVDAPGRESAGDAARAVSDVVSPAAPGHADAPAPVQAEATQMGSATRTAVPPPAAPVPRPTELNALSLMWTVLKSWLAGLFGRR
jgi:carbon monoxide dehydrogenase subunit G